MSDAAYGPLVKKVKLPGSCTLQKLSMLIIIDKKTITFSTDKSFVLHIVTCDIFSFLETLCIRDNLSNDAQVLRFIRGLLCEITFRTGRRVIKLCSLVYFTTSLYLYSKVSHCNFFLHFLSLYFSITLILWGLGW